MQQDRQERARQERNAEVVEIDLAEVFGVLLHWAWLILLVAVIAGAIAFCYSKFALPEEFQSTTKVYVLSRSDGVGDVPTTQDMQVSTSLTTDYAELITSRYVLEKVIADLHLPMDYDQMKACIAVTTPAESRILQITATDTDPARAQTIARAVRDTASAHIRNVMDIDAINIVDDANLPDKKSAPSNGRNALIGAVLGALVVMVAVVVQHLRDDTIKTSEDMEKYLGLSCLALIPIDEHLLGSDGKGAQKRSRFPLLALRRRKRV